jgi:hypothetical protein
MFGWRSVTFGGGSLPASHYPYCCLAGNPSDLLIGWRANQNQFSARNLLICSQGYFFKRSPLIEGLPRQIFRIGHSGNTVKSGIESR